MTISSKSMYITLLIAFILLQIFIVLNASANTITVAAENWNASTNKNGSGLYWDILNAVYEPEGAMIKKKHVSYQRAIGLVKNQMADVAVGSFAYEVSDVVYPKWHIDEPELSVIYRKDQISQWQGTSSLKNRHIAWNPGYRIDQYIDRNFSLHQISNPQTSINLVMEGKLDAFILGKQDINAAKQVLYIDKNALQIKSLTKLPMYVVFADTEKGRELAEKFDRRFEALLQSGEIKQLFEKWHRDQYPFKSVRKEILSQL